MNHQERAYRALDGLSVGDAFGQRLADVDQRSIGRRELPDAPWPWTEDTHQALSVLEVLRDRGGIDQDALVEAFVARYAVGAHRGYDADAHKLLARLESGVSWRSAAKDVYGGEGSRGKGAAARATPIGAWFANHPARAADEARLSAAVTHAHNDGIAGANAVAVATALRCGAKPLEGAEFLRDVARYAPHGAVRERLDLAADIAPVQYAEALAQLGQGGSSAADAVPFAIWIVAHHGGDFAGAMWLAGTSGPARGSVCAIVGGVLAGSGTTVPSEWRSRREPLPEGFTMPGGVR